VALFAVSDCKVTVGGRLRQHGVSEADGGVQDRPDTCIYDCQQGEIPAYMIASKVSEIQLLILYSPSYKYGLSRNLY